MRIALLPTDERPNTLGYAMTIAEAHGIEAVPPPPESMSSFHRPADTETLTAWIQEVADEVDHILVSLEFLGHGGLVPSRNTAEPAFEVLKRLEVLRNIEAPVTAYGVIMRLPTYNNATRARQEPPYWATHGEKIGTLSTAWDEAALGLVDPRLPADLRATVPDDYLQDMLRRRLRNHTINLAALEMAASDCFELLVLSSDDTAPTGLPAAERRHLGDWADRLGGPVLMYPGADEVPSVLVARIALRNAGIVPRIAVDCPEVDGLERTAPYEDRPFGVGLANQVRALGGVISGAGDASDVTLIVHAPAKSPGDWVMSPPTAPTPTGIIDRVVAATASALDGGKPVALVDVRYANGGDPALIAALDKAGLLRHLTSYGGWNTAGNSLGTTLAAGVAPLVSSSEQSREAVEKFLARKVIEDAHYLPVVRRRIQETMASRGAVDLPLEELDAVHRQIARELNDWVGTTTLREWEVSNATLPRAYPFMVDFDLTR